MYHKYYLALVANTSYIALHHPAATVVSHMAVCLPGRRRVVTAHARTELAGSQWGLGCLGCDSRRPRCWLSGETSRPRKYLCRVPDRCHRGPARFIFGSPRHHLHSGASPAHFVYCVVGRDAGDVRPGGTRLRGGHRCPLRAAGRVAGNKKRPPATAGQYQHITADRIKKVWSCLKVVLTSHWRQNNTAG